MSAARAPTTPSVRPSDASSRISSREVTGCAAAGLNAREIERVTLSSGLSTMTSPATPNATGTLEFATSNPKGDVTVLLDAINLIRREAGDIVVQNPSFEASGAMALYIEGPNTALMSGWDISSALG